MSRSLRRGILAASAALAAVTLSACAAGSNAATLQVRPDNAGTSVGDIEVQNVVVIAGEGEGAPASVSATVVNNGDKAEKLTSVAVVGLRRTFRLAGPEGEGDITVPAGGTVLLGGEGNASATTESTAGSQNFSVGAFEKVIFDLSQTGEVSLQATVVPSEGYWEPFGPTPQPGSAAPEANGTESPGADASPSGEPGHGGQEEGQQDQQGAEGEGGPEEGSASEPPASPNASPSGSASAGH